MARLIFPDDLQQQTDLLGIVKTKHDNEGAKSVLIPLLAEKNIVLADDQKAMNDAEKQEAAQQLLTKQAENYVQLRDLKSEPTFKHIRGSFQFLKSLFKPNVQKLGDWGATVDNKNRIVYPPEFAEMVEIFRKMKAKHDSYPANKSPLQPFLNEQNIDLAADDKALKEAEKNEQKQLQTRKDSENATQQRNKLWQPVTAHLKDIGNYLMKLFSGEEKKAGEWGFTVDDSPRAPKERTSTIKISSQKTLKGIVIGSTLKNIGTVPVNIYKGTTTTGTPAIVKAGQMLGIIKGFSTVTVVNPSAVQSAKVKTLMSGG